MTRTFINIYFFIVVAAGCLCICHVQAQSSFLADGVSDFIRRSALLNPSDQTASMMVQSFSANYRALDFLLPGWRSNKRSNKLWLPLSLTQQYNSHHPYGWNDGGMIPAKGFQTVVSAGYAVKAGKFSIQVKPEFIYAANPSFETFSTEQGIYWINYYKWLNKTDMPERFADKPFTRLYPGQSSIRYNTGAVSIGLSTENLWWGPGMRNALVMSNNAPGFLHGTINTIKPIQTKIGTFEGQLIAGRLTSSGILPPERNRYDTNGIILYAPKPDGTRYLIGMELSWQPKWIRGLFVGFTKVSYLYRADMTSITDVLPLEGIITSASEKNGHKASLGSLFLRYVMPEEKAEIYMEYGRKDRSPSLINIVTDQGYPRAYVAGFRKLFFAKNSSYIQFWSELSQLELPRAELIFDADSWYTHPYVRQGYTNQGKSLGAGIGPGSNSQMLDISWVKGFNKAGIMIERIARNNDFFYNTFIRVIDPTRHWIDLSTTFHVDWQFKKCILTSQLAFIRSLNYNWSILPGLSYFTNGYDVLNVHARVSISYPF